MRVYELAKELGMSNKDLLARLHELGAAAKTHSSSVDEAAIELLREEHGAAAGSEAPAAAEAKAPAAGPESPAAAETEAPAGEPEAPAAPAAAADAEAPGAEPEQVIRVRGAVIVKDLAGYLNMPPNRLIAELMGLNILASINQRVDIEVAQRLAEKHGYTLVQERRAAAHKPVIRNKEEEEPERADRPEDLDPRAPVVTFLGHVDHGKTSLLDKIRNTAVVSGESGGITQHIGAYTVDVQGRRITFLDTPGHAAFTAMRARGATLTDIAVIIIAADDGMMPQTEEAISHARAAGVAVMVAINKMDLPAANADRVRQQLQAMDLTPEDWGGETICCEVSAQTGQGLDHLLEMILLQADLQELKANPRRSASGFVIEAFMEPGRGPVANLLVKHGTLKLGDMVVCGPHLGRVRALTNDHGAKLKAAGPSTPVRCLGLSGIPEAGAAFRVSRNERAARATVEAAREAQKREQLGTARKASLDSLFDQMKATEQLELRIVLKADTQGSVEAIAHALRDIRSEKVSLNIILSGTGNITENDVMLASASDAVVLGFHVGKEPGVDRLATHEGVEIRLHTVIYELTDEVRDAMLGLLAPRVTERVTGHAEIRQVFALGRRGKVAGCLVTDGTVQAAGKVRVKRGGEVLWEGGVLSLKHFQDDVRDVREGQECGIRLEGYADFEAGDVLEFYTLEEVEQTL
ncbi:MAG: translation initiation factor IF-2 [Lentisphaerae bacterium]|nr:translation initiation factor IF-2 [Lentisphaerota bacterium]